MTQDDPAPERVREHVKDVRNSYYHLITHVLINALMIVIDRREGMGGDFLGRDWAYWLRPRTRNPLSRGPVPAWQSDRCRWRRSGCCDRPTGPATKAAVPKSLKVPPGMGRYSQP
jgi:hypothetical protein